MSAARARRRLMAHERYHRRAFDLGARCALSNGGTSAAHAVWFWRAMAVGRWSPIGVRREPWTVPPPRHMRWRP